jgi:hypothetical protein
MYNYAVGQIDVSMLFKKFWSILLPRHQDTEKGRVAADLISSFRQSRERTWPSAFGEEVANILNAKFRAEWLQVRVE